MIRVKTRVSGQARLFDNQRVSIILNKDILLNRISRLDNTSKKQQTARRKGKADKHQDAKLLVEVLRVTPIS